MRISIRPPVQNDYAKWCVLYAAYADFYQVNQTQEMRDRVWTWIQDPLHEVKGLLGFDESETAIGLAHYRSFQRPLSATTGGYLDDLFVAPSARNKGVGSDLIAAVVQIGKKNNWSVLRWITAEENVDARMVYDKVATQTSWVTYDVKL